jgi:type VI secretion system protein ImpK
VTPFGPVRSTSAPAGDGDGAAESGGVGAEVAAGGVGDATLGAATVGLASLASPQVAPPPEYPLVPPFSDFYLEMAAQRRRIVSGQAGDDDPGARSILLDLLRRQEAAAESAGAGAIYRQAEYVMAAFADEVFRELHWPGRAEWIENPLELELFGSRDGRDEVYRRIDALLARGDAADRELARVDLAVLSLGFRGRYRGPEETSHIDAYRRELFTVAFDQPPAPLPPDVRLFPQAYDGVASRGRVLRLPALRPAVVLFTLAAAGYLVVSHAVWRSAVSEVAEVVGRILALP